MKRILSAVLACVTLSAALVGCSTSSEAFDSKVTFNGSSTLAPVISTVGENFKEKFKTWDQVNSDFPKEDISIDVTSGGSGQGVKAAIEKTSDFGMVSRSIKEEEKTQFKELEETQLGIDALTIAVNPNNPLLAIKDDLTKEEIIKLFSGEYTYWNELDASLPQEEVVIVIRDIGGGAHEVFQSKVMGETEVATNAIQAPSMGALVQKITENQFAIGYASFGVVNQNEGKIIPLKVDGVEPSAENIQAGTYIIQRPLIIINEGKMDASQEAFIAYLKGEEGKQVIESLGFIATK